MLRILCWFPCVLFSSVFYSHAQTPETYFDYCGFSAPDARTYIEAFFAIESSSLQFVPTGDGYQAAAEVVIVIRQGENIANFDKFNIYSEIVDDPAGNAFSLLGQRRIEVTAGAYTIETTISDIHREESQKILTPVPLLIDYPEEKVSISDIRFLDQVSASNEQTLFTRNGVEMVPYAIDFFPTSKTSLQYYAEIYDPSNLITGQDILVVHNIRVRGEEKTTPGLQKYTKEKGSRVLPVLGEFQISDLPSGNYDLVIEIRNRENQLLASKKKLFQRSNKLAIGDLDNIRLLDVSTTFVSNYSSGQLQYYLQAIKPISNDIEGRAINDILATNDSVLMKQFLFNFWQDRNLDDPHKEWKAYLVHIQYTEDNFRTMNRYGFETDRGRVYLQYGPPSERAESNFDASSLPHEIWQYDIIPNKETNVIFVFLNSDLISNDYRLIHSSATGEIRDERWKVRIFENFQIEDNKDLENSNTREHFGTKISDQYDK